MDEHDSLDHSEIVGRLRALGRAPLDAGTAERTLARARAASVPRGGRVRLRWVAAAAIAGFVAGGTGLAAADVLPAPVQDTAHSLLNSVGVHVPPGHERYNEPTVCAGGPYRNHGAYVRAHADDPDAGKSPCGKPVRAVNGKRDQSDKNGNEDAEHDSSSDRHGPPPWGHGKSKAGHDGQHDAKHDGKDDGNAVAPPLPSPPDESPSTTTTSAPTTTTTLTETTTTTTQA